MSGRRFYRRLVTGARLTSFNLTVKESDLWIALSSNAYSPQLPAITEKALLKCRLQLETYILEHPQFRDSLHPCVPLPNAPALVVTMARAGNRAGVGPMAAVAGAIAEEVGRFLSQRSAEILVENGGDLFLRTEEEIKVGIYAGKSALSGRLALRINPAQTPLGICTSSASVGPSLSFGRADAAVVLSPSAALADAVATALANRISCADDFDAALKFARNIEGITGVLLVCAGEIAAWGEIELTEV